MAMPLPTASEAGLRALERCGEASPEAASPDAGCTRVPAAVEARRGRLVLLAAGAGASGLPAVELDRRLRHLSLDEARCRRALGRLAAAFRRRSGHHRLGFAALDDYARERLGLSGRELQSLAAVFSRLEELPAIRAAFEQGEISWSKTRLLAAAARTTSEDEWLGRARGQTVRALLADIRTRRCGAGLRPPDGILLDSSLDEESGRIEGETTARLRIRCPVRVRLLWRRTVELGRRMLGAQSVVWRVAEAIAAEGTSAQPAGEIETGSIAPAGGAAILRAPGDDEGAAAAEPVALRDAFPLVSWDAPRPAADGAPGAPLTDGSSDMGRAPASSFAEDDEPLPEDLAKSLEGLDAFDLDERMRLVVRSLQTIDARLARVVRILFEGRLHRALGFESFDRYAQERLGMSPARARALVRIDREVEAVAGLGRAFRGGELSWVRVLALLPVVRGPFADRWIARAGEVHVRRLADEVEWALSVRDAVLAKMADGSAAVAGFVEAMGYGELVAADSPSGGRIAVAPPPEGLRLDLAAPPAGLGSAGDADGPQAQCTPAAAPSDSPAASTGEGGTPHHQTCARSAEETGDWCHEMVDAEVTFFGPASVVALFRDSVAAFTRPHEPHWRGLERLVLHAMAEWERQPRHRDPIFARDGWRCTIPCCSARRDLHDHHREFRSRGGGNQRWNRTATCALCRTRHNAHYADFRIMPHGLREVLSAAVERELQAA